MCVLRQGEREIEGERPRAEAGVLSEANMIFFLAETELNNLKEEGNTKTQRLSYTKTCSLQNMFSVERVFRNKDAKIIVMLIILYCELWHTHTHVYIYIYMHIYIRVYVPELKALKKRGSGLWKWRNVTLIIADTYTRILKLILNRAKKLEGDGNGVGGGGGGNTMTINIILNMCNTMTINVMLNMCQSSKT